MISLYLIRHAETVGNERRIFQGHIDLPISERGEEQLKLLSRRFENIHIDRAYSSPLPRARKTALYALAGKDIPVEDAPLLIEISGGSLEGKSFSEIFSEGSLLGDTWKNHIDVFKAPDGESMAEVYERVWRGLLEILENSENEGKEILVVSHGAAVRAIICRLLYGELSRMPDTGWSDNTAVSHIYYENGKITVDFVNDNSHLPEEMRRQNKSFFNFGRKE